MGKYNDGKWQGQHIYKNYKSNGTKRIKWIGRGNKLDGLNYFIENDINDNKWQTQKYEYSCQDNKPDNDNWFSIDNFIIHIDNFIKHTKM